MQFRYVVCSLLAMSTSVVMAAESGLRVGAARVDQTGPLGRAQTGKYDHERSYVRAIVLDNGNTRAAIISYEGTDDTFDTGTTRNRVAQLINAPLANVIISNTHTHSRRSAPTWMGNNAAPAATASTEILAAVTQAQSRLQPARMSYGTGAAYLNVNRDAIDPATHKWTQGSNLQAQVDRTVAVLSFLKPDGSPVAAYVTYGMHPINGYVLGVVSGDFPGAMSRHVEKNFGDDVVVAFAQGASGDVNPLHLRLSNNAMASRAGHRITGFQMNREASEGVLRMADIEAASGKGPGKPAADPKVMDQLFRFIESQGQLLGEEVIRVMTFSGPPVDQVRIAGAQKLVSCPGRIRTNGDAYDPNTREGIAGTYKEGPNVDIQVGMLALGAVAVASVNGEIYTAIGQRIRNEAPMKHTMIVTPVNERVRGYIPDDASFGHQTFQVLESRLKPGCAESGIANAVVELQTQYLNGG